MFFPSLVLLPYENKDKIAAKSCPTNTNYLEIALFAFLPGSIKISKLDLLPFKSLKKKHYWPFLSFDANKKKNKDNNNNKYKKRMT